MLESALRILAYNLVNEDVYFIAEVIQNASGATPP